MIAYGASVERAYVFLRRRWEKMITDLSVNAAALLRGSGELS